MSHIGRYEVLRELGRGAMGVVFEARDPLIGRIVAIKVIRLDSLGSAADAAWLQDRLFREARSAGALSHPGIVVIHDVGAHEELSYVAMERVDGPTLEQVLAEHRPDPQQTLSILRQTAAALDHAHENGVIHRDVKPGNLMLHKGTTVKVTDFGIAKITDTQHRTRTGTVIGTPSYMSPEQITAQPLDGRSDQFSLAVIAFEMLTGRRPFTADTLAGLVHQIVYEERPFARAWRSDLPPSVDEILKKGLSKDAADRYPTCQSFVDALENALGTPAGAGIGTATEASFKAAFGIPTRPEVRAGEIQPTMTMAQAVSPSQSPLAAPLATPLATPLAARRRLLLVGGISLVIVLGAAGIGVRKWFAAQPPIQQISTQAPVVPPPPVRVAEQPAAPVPETKIAVKQAPIAPPQITFASDVQSITAGQRAGLRWSVPTATEVFIDQIGRVDRAGSQEVSPAETTSYKLTAKGPWGETTRTVTVTVDVSTAEARRAWQAKDAVRLRSIADGGNPEGQYFLGLMYATGQGVTVDNGQAASWYRKAAEQGHPLAQVNLAVLYQNGRGVPRDDAQALAWSRKAADQGNLAGENILGSIYQNGRGVAVDDAQAVAWFRKAADLGFAPAQANLGVMYQNGRGVSKDDVQAVAWYQKAASQGHPGGQTNLGVMYQNGRGVPQDDVQAVVWFQKAADQGYGPGQNSLGVMYQNGRGVPQDEAKAAGWYRKAAEQGGMNAQHNLGFMYATGRGVPRDDAQAVAWYRKAADQGHPMSQNNLGLMYANGRAVAKDDVQAVAWYQKSADQGNPNAQNSLGFMYENGRGVAKSREVAIDWYRKAAAQRFQPAVDALKRLGVSQ